MSYITGLAGTPGAGWFTDSNGHPKLWVATETWGLPTNAGQWNGSGGGTVDQDYDNFFSQRAAQGFNVCMTDPVWAATGEGGRANGNTWDGVTPLAGGSTDPSSAALNGTFWARIDYMFSSAASNGFTIGFVPANIGDDVESGNWQDGWTATQWQDWGALLGARYKSTPNLIWLMGNDMFSPYSDSILNAVYAGVTGTGDTHLWSAWYNAETTSRYTTDTSTSEDWGASNAAFNFGYTYNAGYFNIEYQYGEVANEGASSLLTPIWGDGYFWNGASGNGYDSTYDRALRQEWWWTLASGARGILGEAENVYPWSADTCPAAVTGDWFFANNALNIVTAFTALPEWWKLIPDLSSALVTAGRGTQVTGYTSGGSGGQYEPAFTSNWVAASRTPDGRLALLYMPKATTVTVNTALLAAGWTAKWTDPVSGATSSAGTGPAFNSTAKGNNSEGDPDWVLAFQAPASTPSGIGPVLAGFRS
jgi:Protein of unknown function (DUF4038)/Putative collagen-binding domain of a collagenase